MKKLGHDCKDKNLPDSAWLGILVRQNDEIIELLEQISKQISEISTTKIVFDQPKQPLPSTTQPNPTQPQSPWYVDPGIPTPYHPVYPWTDTPWAISNTGVANPMSVTTTVNTDGDSDKTKA